MKAPITALVWHSRFGYTIIAGDACGDVHTISLNNSEDVSAPVSAPAILMRFHSQRNTQYHTFNNVPGSVHCIVQSGILLAVGSGNAVQLIKQGTIGSVSFPTFFITLGDKHDWQLPGRSSPGFRTHPSSQNLKESFLNLWHDRFTSWLTTPCSWSLI